MPQFLHLSSGVANIIPTWWDPEDTEAEGLRLNCSGWRALGFDNICQNFSSNCPYLSCGRETEAHGGEMIGP